MFRFKSSKKNKLLTLPFGRSPFMWQNVGENNNKWMVWLRVRALVVNSLG